MIIRLNTAKNKICRRCKWLFLKTSNKYPRPTNQGVGRSNRSGRTKTQGSPQGEPFSLGHIIAKSYSSHRLHYHGLATFDTLSCT